MLMDSHWWFQLLCEVSNGPPLGELKRALGYADAHNLTRLLQVGHNRLYWS